MKLNSLIPILWVWPVVLCAQPPAPQAQPAPRVKTSVGFQIWGLYTMNGQVFDTEANTWQPTDDRLNFMLRRTRLTFKDQPNARLRYNLTLAIDHVGNDDYDGATGGANNGGFPAVSVWNARIEWQVLPEKDVLWLTAGYFAPQFHRESFTGALVVPSLEKAMSQNYARRHLTGTGPGRAAGINLGGLWQAEGTAVAFSYDLGLFAPTFGTASAGVLAAAVWTARGVLHLGDPEFERYRLGAGFNTFGKRKGISLAAATSYQGATDFFERSTSLAFDLLANYGPFNLKGDYTLMQRAATDEAGSFTLPTRTWHLAASINLPVGKYVLEPSVMAYGFDGPTDALGQSRARAVRAFSGSEIALDFGLNLHINPNKLIVQIHYTLRDGNAGAAGPEARVNQFFSQNGQAIRRGDWLGAGLIGRF